MRRANRGTTTPGTNAGSFAPTAKAETDLPPLDPSEEGWD